MEDCSSQVAKEASQGKHPQLYAKTLAAVQSNKLTSTIFSPFLDGAVGKDLYAGKERKPTPSSTILQPAVSVVGPQPPYHQDMPYQLPVRSSVFGALGAYSNENLFCDLPPTLESNTQGLIREKREPPYSAELRPAVSETWPQAPYHLDMFYQQAATSLVSGTPGACCGEQTFYDLPPPPQSDTQELIGMEREPPSSTGFHLAVSETEPEQPYHLDMFYQQPATSSVSGTFGAYGGEHTFHDLQPPPHSNTKELIGKEREPPYSPGLRPADSETGPHLSYHLNMSHQRSATSSVSGMLGDYDVDHAFYDLLPPPQSDIQELIGKESEPPTSTGFRPALSETGPQPPYHLDRFYQRPATSSVTGILGAYNGEHTFYDLPPPSQSDTQELIGKEREPPYSHGLQPADSETRPHLPYHLDMSYQRSERSSASRTIGDYDGEHIFYDLPPPPQSDIQKLIGKEMELLFSTGLRPVVSETGSEPPYHSDMPYQRPATCSASEALGVYDGENIFYNSPQNDTQGYIGMVDTEPASHKDALYSRVANQSYESWPSTMNADVKMDNASTSAIPWLEVRGPEAAVPHIDMNEAVPTLQNSYTNFTHMSNLYLKETKNIMQRGQDSEAPFVSHSRRHMNQRLFVCKWLLCDMKFASPDALDSHLFVHIGEEPVPCRSCSERFVHAESLLNHMKIHNRTDYDKKTGCSSDSYYDSENNLSNPPASNSSFTIDTGENVW